MITIKINGKARQFPTQWEDLTFQQFIELWEEQSKEGGGDHTRLLSIMAGFDLTTATTLVGLDQLITVASFIHHPSQFKESYEKIGPYKVPRNSKDGWDIRFESLGQFEDMRSVFNKLKTDLLDHTKAYSRYVAIYLQKLRDGVYDPLRVPEVEDEVRTYPAGQVIALGSFFFGRLYISLRGIKTISQPTAPTQKKSKPASRNSTPRLASTPRSPKSRRR